MEMSGIPLLMSGESKIEVEVEGEIGVDVCRWIP